METRSVPSLTYPLYVDCPADESSDSSQLRVNSDSASPHDWSSGGLFTLSQDDRHIPTNWPLAKRIAHTAAYGFTTFGVQLAASAISPGTRQISEEFGVGREVSTLVFSIYVLGNIVGPVIFAPVSEVWGRKVGVFVPCMMAGAVVIVCANVSSVWALLVFRFIAGVFGAAPLVSTGGAIGDLWLGGKRALGMSIYGFFIVVATSISPIIGAALVTTGSFGWRWICWLSGLLNLATSVLNFLLLSESYLPVVEQALARQDRLKTSRWQLHAEHDLWTLTRQEFVTVHFARPVLIFLTPIAFLMVVYGAFVYGLTFLLIESVAPQYQMTHSFSFVGSYCPLIGILCGYMVGIAANVYYASVYDAKAQKSEKRLPPEERLPPMMSLAWLIPSGFFIFGWTMQPTIHWIVPTLGLGCMGTGLAVVLQGTIIYIVDVYKRYAASGIAANTVMRSIFGGVLPLVAHQMFNTLGVHWASSLIGFISLALFPVPWVFFYFGSGIRTHDPFGNRLGIHE